MKEKHFRILLWSSFFLLLAVVCYFFQNEAFNTIRSVEADAGYLLHEEEQIPREEIDLYIVHEGKLYLFYIDSELINVYSDSGEFLYGLQFPDAQNGRSDIACRDGLLYVDERGSGYYVFEGKDLLRFERGSIHNEERKELQPFFAGEYAHSESGYTYTYVAEENKIIRTGNGVTEDFLKFPKRDKRIMNLMYIALMIVVVISLMDKLKEK